jgi:hypothetical protein
MHTPESNLLRALRIYQHVNGLKTYWPTLPFSWERNERTFHSIVLPGCGACVPTAPVWKEPHHFTVYLPAARRALLAAIFSLVWTFYTSSVVATWLRPVTVGVLRRAQLLCKTRTADVSWLGTGSETFLSLIGVGALNRSKYKHSVAVRMYSVYSVRQSNTYLSAN